MKDKNTIIRARNVIEYMDSAEAFHVLKEIGSNFDDPNFSSYIDSLSVVAFPHLDEASAANIIQNNLLLFFQLDAPIEALISERLFLFPYNIRKQVRENLKQSILSNNQLLGKKNTVSQWIDKFDKSFDSRTRDASSVIRFVKLDPDLGTLNDDEKIILQKILYLYDTFLVYTLPDTDENLTILQKVFAERGELITGSEEPAQFGQNQTSSTKISSVKTETLSLADALRQYPSLGKKYLSVAPILDKVSGKSATPTIENWLRDYALALGQGRHSSMERMRYLFHSENGRKLTSPEREKLAIILKSLDEGTALTVDPERQEIIFPETKAGSLPFVAPPSFETAPKSVSAPQFAQEKTKNLVEMAEKSPMRIKSSGKSVRVSEKAAPVQELPSQKTSTVTSLKDYLTAREKKTEAKPALPPAEMAPQDFIRKRTINPHHFPINNPKAKADGNLVDLREE